MPASAEAQTADAEEKEEIQQLTTSLAAVGITGEFSDAALAAGKQACNGKQTGA